MFQLGLFSLDTDNTTPNIIWKGIRSIFAFIDRVAYSLLVIVYQILFNIADATFFSSETIKAFYGRVQLIIGVFMIFKLSISLLQAVINPDVLTDKQNGMGQIITRVVIMLALFTAIIPLNIPNAEDGSYNAYLNENGLLFGTLYSLQARVLDTNVLGKLILGNGVESASEQGKQTADGASNLAAFILKGFIRINLDPNEGTDETEQSNWMCKSGDFTDATDAYISDDVSISDILDNINAECKNSDGKKRYVFAYLPLISTVVGLIFTVVLLGFCIDIAMRAIKLAILRLIAPIPIISYIDPKSAKDGSFAAWTKMLISTYLDLFLRLAIVYFATFLVTDIIDNGLSVPWSDGIIGKISTIFIFVGIFYFAKQAPKFIKDALGLKGNMSNVGLSGMAAFAGAVRQGGTFREAREAYSDSIRAQGDAAIQGKGGPSLGMSYNLGRDHSAKIITGDDNMTGRKMDRGAKHLRAMGINNLSSNDAKNAMYAADDNASLLEDQYQRFTKGSMSGTELSNFINNNRSDLEAMDSYRNAGTTEERNEAIRQYLYEKKESARVEAALAKKKYDDISGMEKKYGEARSYEAKYQSRRTNRAIISTGNADNGYGPVQRWRSGWIPPSNGNGATEATSSTTPVDSGVDITPIGSTGTGPIGGDHNGPGIGPGGPPPA